MRYALASSLRLIALFYRSRAIDEAVRMIEELGLVEQWHERVTNEP
jgi:hypothetical protein